MRRSSRNRLRRAVSLAVMTTFALLWGFFGTALAYHDPLGWVMLPLAVLALAVVAWKWHRTRRNRHSASR
jgi:hypothetical protein